ncbi:MAG TPA: hypothetical protein VF101_05810 [Gaiellaceae bacterium]
MTAAVGGGLALALGSAAALNWGYVVQHGAASALPPLSLRRPLASLALLFRHARWLAGFLVGIGGWVLYVVALRLAPLSLVQSASAGGIGILALLASRRGATLDRRERAGVGAATVGLLLLGLSLVHHGVGRSSGSWTTVAAWMAASVVVAGLAAGAGTRALAPGAGLGIAAGVLYAAGDVGTKAAVGGGAMLLFVPALLACHGLAFVALQLGFQRGKALATAGVATLFTNSLPILAGMAVFHEGVPGGAAGAARVAAFVGVVAGAAALARPDAPAEALRRAEPAPGA